MKVPLKSRALPAVAGIAVLVLHLSACDLVKRYRAGPPEEHVARAVQERWAAPGRPFLDGLAGTDTVASVKATGARSWDVAVMPLGGGSPTSWTLEVTRVEVFPTFPGPAFSQQLADRARELGMRTFMPPEVTSELTEGSILSVADVEVRYGRADRSGRNTATRVAYLVPGPEGSDPVWRILGVSRTSNVLVQALRTVTDDMLTKDDRVMSCMGTESPVGVRRAVQLACVRKVWAAEFGR